MDILYIWKPSNYPFSCQTIQKLTCTCSTKSMKDNLIWLWLKHNAYNYVISQHTTCTWIIVMQLIHNHTINNDYIKQIIIISIIIYFLFLYSNFIWIVSTMMNNIAYCSILHAYIYLFHYFEIHHYNPIGNSHTERQPTITCCHPRIGWAHVSVYQLFLFFIAKLSLKGMRFVHNNRKIMHWKKPKSAGCNP